MRRPAIRALVLVLLGLGLALVPAAGAPLEKLAPKIWVEKPVLPCQELVQTESLYLYSTTITARNVFLLADGRLLVGDGYSLLVYEPSLKLAGLCLELSKKAGLTGPGQEYDFILPDRQDRFVAVGFRDSEHHRHLIGVVDLADFQYKETVSLSRGRKAFHLELKKNDRADEPFRPGSMQEVGRLTPLFYDSEALVLQAAIPSRNGIEYLLKLNLNRKTLESTPFPDRCLQAWSADQSILSCPREAPGRLVWEKLEKTSDLSESFIPARVGFDKKGRLLFQEKTEDGTAFVLFDPVKEEKIPLLTLPAARFQPWGGVLHYSAGGDRLFFTGILDGRHNLFVSDLAEKSVRPLAGSGDLDAPPDFASCGGGEFFCYLLGKVLHLGYLEDRSAPDLSVRMEPLFQGAAVWGELSIQPECHDVSFTSGCDDDSVRIEVNEKPVGRGEKVSLKPGLNTVKVSATDRAGNRALLEKDVERLDIPPVTLEMIATTPQNYNGRLVSLEGLVWGWAATGMNESERNFSAGKRFFSTNNAANRNVGTFADRSGAAYYPVPPSVHGWFRVFARVTVEGEKWQLEPILSQPLDSLSTEP